MNSVAYSSSNSFSSLYNILISVERSNFTLALLKAAWHANPGAERNFAGSSSYTLRGIFLKFSNTPANSNVSL